MHDQVRKSLRCVLVLYMYSFKELRMRMHAHACSWAINIATLIKYVRVRARTRVAQGPFSATVINAEFNHSLFHARARPAQLYRDREAIVRAAAAGAHAHARVRAHGHLISI